MKKVKQKIVILSTLMMVVFSSVLINANASETFTKVTPSNVPEFYDLEDEDKQLYSYKTKNEEILYRIYGELTNDSESLGFYNSNEEGELIYPLTLVDVAEDEKNSLMVEVPKAKEEGEESQEETEEPGEEGPGEEEEEPFVPSLPETVPEYYEEIEETGIYKYKKKDGNTYYRVYGTYEEMAEGFYACDVDGNLIEPFVPLDQTEEANNAYNSGVESNVADELVDNQAYVNNAKIEQIVDGTAIWDDDDNPGNDSNPSNGIVRTFDKIAYTVSYQTNLQNQTTTTYFKNGWIYVEFVIPNCTFKEAKFDIDAMTWLEEGKQEEKGGNIVLTGKQRLQAGDKESIIPGTSSLKVVIDTLGMENGAVIQPTFTVWAQGNPESQYHTIKPKEVKISAAPSYNIELKRNETLQWKDDFDFSTGNTDAINKDKGIVTGRMYGYGVIIELRNENVDKKLKGIELPKGKITFDLEFDAYKGTENITGNGSNELMPLLWDYKANSGTTDGKMGRNMSMEDGISNFFRYAHNASVYNQYQTDDIYKNVMNATKGGNWEAKQTNNTISVEVDAYQFLINNSEYRWPTHRSGSTPTSSNLYLGEDKARGVFSGGYFQILFPFPEELEENSNFQLKVKDLNMKATSLTDEKVVNTDQVKSNDDETDVQVLLTLPGRYDKQNHITSEKSGSAWSNNLSTSNVGMGADGWTTQGSKIRIWGGMTTNQANDIENFIYATNLLQKFDDKAFQPLASAHEFSFASYRPGTMEFKIRYATKPGGVGWDSDTEMNLAKEEDLEYFKSMADLKKKYPSGVCVAFLTEGRGGRQDTDRTEIGVVMEVLKTAEVGKVYQTTNNVKIWNKENGTKMTFDDSVLSDNSNIIDKLKQPDTFLDGTKSIGSSNYGPYIKTEYDNDGNILVGTHGPSSFRSGASVLIVGLESSITKSVDQQKGGQTKQVYDISVGQRRVDYVLSPTVRLAGNKEGVGTEKIDVTITDTLPKNVSVTPTTKYYYGGNYVEDSSNVNGGEIVGGTELELETGYPMANADGTTTLKWVINDVIPGEGMEKIHFSASIGNPGADDDVEDGDQLTNTVTIKAEGDGRSIHTSHGNISTYMILISKLSSSSFIKMIQTPIEEVNSNMIYTLSESNISQEKIADYTMLDVLPVNGDGRGSKIDGTYSSQLYVDLSKSVSSDTTLEIYTTKVDMKGKKVNDVSSSDFALIGTINSGNDTVVQFPAGTTAYYIEGVIGGLDSYKLTLTLTPENNKGGNVYANDASSSRDGISYTYAPTVAGVIIERKITGLVWLDANKDGIRQGSETVLDGVKVGLIDLDTKAIAKDVHGQDVSSVITRSNGRYEFRDLPEGNYRVIFESDTLDLEKYCTTLQNVGSVQTSSKGTPRVDRLGYLVGAYIENIKLPAKEQVSAFGYTAAYNDLGLYEYEPNQVLVVGQKELTGYKDTNDIENNQFIFLMKEDNGNDKSGYEGMPTEVIGVNKGGSIYFGNLTFSKVGVYKFTLEEVNGGQTGYIYDDKIIEMTVQVKTNTETQELEAKATYTVEGNDVENIVFENEYIPLPTEYTPNIEKKISGDKPEEESEFIFKLVGKDDQTPMLDESENNTKEITIQGEGKNDFGSIDYTEAGVYTYNIYEVLGAEKGYQYDQSIYTLIVTVRDVDGQLKATAKVKDTEDDTVIFTNNYITPVEDIDVHKETDQGVVYGGDYITYTLTVKNTGNQPLVGIRVRDYIPEYTLFDEVYDNGEYGVIDGKEHVTWFIEDLGVGEEVQLRFRVIVDECIPDDYVIPNTALYEVTGDREKPDPNDPNDPNSITNEVRNPTDGSVLGSTYEEPKVEKLEVINERVITSDNTNIVMIGILAGVSLSVIIFLKKNKKKEV